MKVRSDEPGWLDFEVNYVIDDNEVPHDLFSGKTDREFVKIDENTWIAVDEEALRETREFLDHLGAIETAEGFRVPISSFSSLEDFISHIGGIREVAEEYARFLEEITDFRSDESFRVPERIENRLVDRGISLGPYQRAGIHWLLWPLQHHLHGTLADEMGLGQTANPQVKIPV